MTQKEFSEKTGIPQSTMSSWKSRGQTPGMDKLQLLMGRRIRFNSFMQYRKIGNNYCFITNDEYNKGRWRHHDVRAS
ncbi:MAG: helix-turn-helix domain-containing protein [Lachnospiraceae bacterium]|nr:helix-turn-helix domain-containing protein [Lachnospiraceae bacterium]